MRLLTEAVEPQQCGPVQETGAARARRRACYVVVEVSWRTQCHIVLIVYSVRLSIVPEQKLSLRVIIHIEKHPVALLISKRDPDILTLAVGHVVEPNSKGP